MTSPNITLTKILKRGSAKRNVIHIAMVTDLGRRLGIVQAFALICTLKGLGEKKIFAAHLQVIDTCCKWYSNENLGINSKTPLITIQGLELACLYR